MKRYVQVGCGSRGVQSYAVPLVKEYKDCGKLCGVYDINHKRAEAVSDFTGEAIPVYTEGRYSVYGEIAKAVGVDIKTVYENPVKISDIVTNKLYDNYHIADIMMPGLGLYID